MKIRTSYSSVINPLLNLLHGRCCCYAMLLIQSETLFDTRSSNSNYAVWQPWDFLGFLEMQLTATSEKGLVSLSIAY